MNRLRCIDAMHLGVRLKALLLTAVLVSIPLTSPQPTSAATPLELAPGANQFAVSHDSVCAIDISHHLFCWGDNTGATLGLKQSVKFSQAPRRVGTAKWRSVFSGLAMCAVRWDRSLWCWGSAVDRLLPNYKESLPYHFTPGLVTTRAVHAVAFYHGSTCYITSSRELWCSLDGEYYFTAGWRRISQGPTLASRVFGSAFCFLNLDQVIRCIGKNFVGAFPTGDGTPLFVKKPRPVPGKYRSLAFQPTLEQPWCALDTEGFQRCWGARATGMQWSLPTRVSTSWVEENGAPCKAGLCITSPARIDDIQWQTLWSDQCGVLADGSVSCHHEINKALNRGGPQLSVTITDPLSDIQLTDRIGCGSKQDRTLWCWGLQDFSTDSVSGPRTFGRDESDYAISPVLVLRP